MTRIITSGTAATTATMDKVHYGSGYANEVIATLVFRILYDGAAWVISSNTGSDQAREDVSVEWDGVDYKLDITLTELHNTFTNVPVVQVSALAGTTHASGIRYEPQAYAPTVSTVVVRFVDLAAATPAYATAVDTKMSFGITLTGTID